MNVVAEVQSPGAAHYFLMRNDVEKRNGAYYMHHTVQWQGTNSGGNYTTVVETSTPYSGSFNFVRASDGTFSLYLDGVLTVSNLSFGTDRPSFQKYGFFMDANNPCVDMDGTFSNTSSLTGWTQVSGQQYFVTQLLSSTSFRVYTLPF